MKNLAKKLTLFALILFPLLTAIPANAAPSGNENLTPQLELQGEQVIRPGNALSMNLELPGDGVSTVKVTDRSGKVVWTTQMSLEAGATKMKIKVGALSEGVYFLHVVQNGKTAVQTFAVQ